MVIVVSFPADCGPGRPVTAETREKLMRNSSFGMVHSINDAQEVTTTLLAFVESVEGSNVCTPNLWTDNPIL